MTDEEIDRLRQAEEPKELTITLGDNRHPAFGVIRIEYAKDTDAASFISVTMFDKPCNEQLSRDLIGVLVKTAENLKSCQYIDVTKPVGDPS